MERKVDPNGNTYINFYKIASDEEPFHVQWYGGEGDVICGHEKVATMTINAQNVMDFIKTVLSDYVAQCAKIGIAKNVSVSDDYFIFFINFT